MMKDFAESKQLLMGLVGALVGGILGYFAFFWIARQGLYALVLPPALLGFGAGIFAGRRSTPLAIVCGLAGLALGILVEWRFAPFVANKSFSYFITHLHALQPITLIMLVLGAVLSYRFALGFDRRARFASTR